MNQTEQQYYVMCRWYFLGTGLASAIASLGQPAPIAEAYKTLKLARRDALLDGEPSDLWLVPA